MDPFPPTCDPAAYVPRRATDQILDALETGFHAGCRIMALSGPSGLGKTMVLRVLGSRLGDAARCVHLPYTALESADLVTWLLGLLGRKSATADPETALYWAAHDGAPLVLLLDDASAMPLETCRELVKWTSDFGGALRLVVVPVDDGRASRVLAALGDGVIDLRLRAPMNEEETRGYLAARAQRADEPEAVLARLSGNAVPWLHRESAGNPRALHALAGWLLHSDAPAPGTWKPSAEHWLETDGGEDRTLELDTGALVPARADVDSEWPMGGTLPDQARRAPRRASASDEYARRRRRRRR